MRPSILYVIILMLSLSSCAGIKYSNSIKEAELISHVRYLSSDKLQGRLPGSEGDILAQNYIREELSGAGLVPFIRDGLQRFEIPFSAEAGPDNKLSFDGSDFIQGKDFTVMSLSSNSSLKAEVVFAGYGFSVENDSILWNDYAGREVKGKWVMMLRGYPESDTRSSYYESFSSDRAKILSAKDNGAGGVVLVSGEEWDNADILDEPSTEATSTGIPVIQIKRSLADSLLNRTGRTINDIENELNSNPTSYSFHTEKVISAETEIISKNETTANVVMKLDGADKNNEYVIVGAHFDHLGTGGQGSGSRAVDTTGIHHGADDNASGVALMIELAEKLSDKRHKTDRNIIFVAFTAEEKGLLGSKYFVENMGIKPENVNLMVNLDMVGRMKEGNGLQISGVGTAEGLIDTVRSMNDTTILNLNFTTEGYGPSDHTSFYGKNIPVLFITTGAHLDYHTPDDTYDKLNYEGMVKTGDLVCDIVKHAADEPARLAFREAGPKVQMQGMGRRLKVTLGFMPDFAGNVKNGLRADFVTPGKPAAVGGMIKGDIIVAIDNKPVNDIEEYMFRLSQLKYGQTVMVDIIRNGKREILLIQL